MLMHIQRVSSICAAVCTPDCQNGGACVAPGICNCLEGWIGGRCEGGMHIIK